MAYDRSGLNSAKGAVSFTTALACDILAAAGSVPQSQLEPSTTPSPHGGLRSATITIALTDTGQLDRPAEAIPVNKV